MKKELILLLISGIGVSYFFVRTFCPEMLEYFSAHPTQEATAKPAPKLKGLNAVHIVTIPDNVYEYMKTSSSFRHYMKPPYKHIILHHLPDPSYYVKAKKMMKEDYASYYALHGLSERMMTSSCRDCPKGWIIQNCMHNLCLVNPVARKAVIDSSRDAAQLPKLLERFKNW